MIGIYKITSPTKKVYIGQSINIEKRFKYYLNLNCKNQTILHRSLLKYGVEKHRFEIICECSLSELNEKERYYQELYSAIGSKGMNCVLNKTDTHKRVVSQETRDKMSKARLGKKHSEETLLRMSNSQIGKKISNEQRFKISESKKGVKFSEDVKLNMSKARTGRIFSEESKKKMSDSAKGKIVSEETRKKMSTSQKGKKLSKETREKMSISRTGLKRKKL